MSVDATGRYAWPGGQRLARELAQLIDCRGRSVCDLGCCLGALGRLALKLGATSVDFLDGSDDALAAARAGVLGAQPLDERVQRGSAPTMGRSGPGRDPADAEREPRATFHRHQWGEPLPRRYELILGGDILYRSALFAPLLDSIASGLAADGRCLLSDPRDRLEEELPRLAAERGLGWTAEWRSDFTLARLRRQTAAAAPATG